MVVKKKSLFSNVWTLVPEVAEKGPHWAPTRYGITRCVKSRMLEIMTGNV